MRYIVCCIFALLLACQPLLATGVTNEPKRIELRCGNQVVRIAHGIDEPVSAGSYDVRLHAVK